MKNKLLRGIPASPGVVIEKAFIHGDQELMIPERTLTPNEVRPEIERFKKALKTAKGEIQTIKHQMLKKTDKYHARIFDMQTLILEDKKLISEAIQTIRNEKKNAEYVFRNLIKKMVSNFDASNESFRERTSDIKDVLNRVLYHLTSKTSQELSSLPGECIAIAHHLTPSDTVKFSKDKIVGFATDLGGKTAHIVIMARALEIPAVVGLREVTKFVGPGERVIIDGTRGIVIIDPDESTQRSYEMRRKEFQDYTKELETLNELPPTTIDGHTIDLSANIELPIEVDTTLSHGAKGIGLFRTEFLYFKNPPSEEDQYKIYSYVAEKVHPDSVIIRTLDLGGDKISPTYGIEDPNPYLGWRAIRFSLTERELFKSQLRAILRASAKGNVKVMFPMISTIEEVREAKGVLEEVRDELNSQGIPYDKNMDIGIMVEVPSTAIGAEGIAKEVDFLSIGSNDLTQYTLAIDRSNPRVSHLFNPLHPAVLHLIKATIDAGHKSRCWVGLCGEMGAEPLAIPILLGMEIDELSVTPISILETKKIIRSLSIDEAKQIAREVLSLESGREVEKFMHDKITKELPVIKEIIERRE